LTPLPTALVWRRGNGTWSERVGTKRRALKSGVSRHIAGWVASLIRVELIEREGVSVTEIMRSIRREALRRGVEAAQVTEPGITTPELKERWLSNPKAAGVGGREYFGSAKSVRDQMRLLARDTNELMADEAESIKQWATRQPDETLMYREGVVTPEGVEENVRLCGSWTTGGPSSWTTCGPSSRHACTRSRARPPAASSAETHGICLWLDARVVHGAIEEAWQQACCHDRRNTRCACSTARQRVCPSYA
jgi:hypothetical protein